LLVVVGMFAILAMAALAIDLATLYAAKSEAQRAADAAALAGAKAYVFSSSTSGGTVTPASICTNGAAQTTPANVLAQAAAGASLVGGVGENVTNVTCTVADAQNPQIQVTVSRTDLPTYFAKIFGRTSASVSASATAEAYNNSGAANTAQITPQSVKPWL